MRHVGFVVEAASDHTVGVGSHGPDLHFLNGFISQFVRNAAIGLAQLGCVCYYIHLPTFTHHHFAIV